VGIVVSVSGYSPDEMVGLLVLSYVLLITVGIARSIRYALNTIEFGKGFLWFPLLLVVFGPVGLTIVYQFPLRIGSVMFIIGGLFVWLVHELVNIFSRWFPFSVKVSKFKSKRLIDWVVGEIDDK
jgi:hypothetical protein